MCLSCRAHVLYSLIFEPCGPPELWHEPDPHDETPIHLSAVRGKPGMSCSGSSFSFALGCGRNAGGALIVNCETNKQPPPAITAMSKNRPRLCRIKVSFLWVRWPRCSKITLHSDDPTAA